MASSSSSASSPIPQIWRSISSSGNLRRKRGTASCTVTGTSTSTSTNTNTLSNAAGEDAAAAAAFNRNRNGIMGPSPIPLAVLGGSPINGRMSRFSEDLGEDAAGPNSSSRSRPGITIVENPAPRPTERQPPSRAPSPYIARPPIAMGGTSGEAEDAGSWSTPDQDRDQEWEQARLDASQGGSGWAKAFDGLRRECERAFAGLFDRLRPAQRHRRRFLGRRVDRCGLRLHHQQHDPQT
ncbi:hypothetical protein Z517_09716 [Fonsecaea pedrosoi CBS 271.37]|uniref:Uncharacterized protein n=1 Tax=Fonsecaea pedrosoi CBS 271.37 TaxID=1442368 RepID=A0A0D2GF45_9EURO|nr:uncharacterized protein Z517_09716 [Fonsecaea pedrosoi CBS 271.37]KIW77270.1 hypothetical protein Z517_09716 [Fonsecaea pedrosoi CBS 271.37]